MGEFAGGLTGLSIFMGENPVEVRRMADVSREESYRGQENIFLEGQRADAGWWVLDGVVKIVRTTAQGRQVTLEILGPGDGFGLAQLMGFPAYPAQAVALKDSRVARVPADVLTAWGRRCPEFLTSILGQISQRIQRFHQLRILCPESAERKVAATLLWVTEKFGSRLFFSRREIADIAGVAPETAVRAVLAFQGVHWMSITRRSMVVNAPKALAAFVAGGTLAPIP